MSETLINEHPQQRWHPFTRTAFRFAFVYLLLYNLPFPLSAFPYVDKAAEWYNSFWTWIVPRLARATFNREVSTVFNGSGDRTYDQRQRYQGRRSPLYGVWEVEEFSLGQPAPTTSVPRWRRIIFDSPGRVAVQTATDPYERFGLQLDQEKRTLTLRKRKDPGWNTVLTYEQVSPEIITLAGALNGSEMSARLRRTEERKSLLTDRGFHWINEVPFNR